MMTVKDLINQLKLLDPNMEVYKHIGVMSHQGNDFKVHHVFTNKVNMNGDFIKIYYPGDYRDMETDNSLKKIILLK